jgi:hypothetical protein
MISSLYVVVFLEAILNAAGACWTPDNGYGLIFLCKEHPAFSGPLLVL